MTMSTPPRTALYLALLAAAPAFAQDGTDHGHEHELDRVVVRATPLATTAEDLTRPVDVLAGGAARPVVSTAFLDFSSEMPDADTVRFVPPPGTDVQQQDGLDIASFAEGNDTGAGQGRDIDHQVGMVLVCPGERVSHNEPTFGIRIAVLDRLTAIDG